MLHRATFLALILAASAAQAQVVPTSMPVGEPALLALQAIRSAGHPCPAINSAVRDASGGISAVCDNGEKYAITRLPGIEQTFAFRCSVARKYGANIC